MNTRPGFYLLSKGIYFILFICCLHIPGFSQTSQTLVKGRIIDGETNEGIPFVNVMFIGTSHGTTSDIDGNYTLNTIQPCDSIAAFYLGYSRIIKRVKPNSAQEINFVLRHAAKPISEVVIAGSDNPSVRIMRKVLASKDKNNREKLDAYEYQAYSNLEIDLKNVPDYLKQWRILHRLRFAFDQIDSTNVTEDPQLPLMFSETVSDFYFRGKPPIRKEVIKANKLSGLEQKSISQYTGDMYLDVNPYQNIIRILGKDFISPVSDKGFLYYRYLLVDSSYLSGHICYQIRFVARRKAELVFEGNMWIADSTWAVKRLEMHAAPDANMNFINELSIHQEYEIREGHWMLVSDRFFADLYIPAEKVGLYARKTGTYSHIQVNKPHEHKFYSPTNYLIVSKDLNKPDAYWEKARPDTLSKNEQSIYQLMDSIQKLRIYKNWHDLIVMLTKGYKPMGWFELGPYYTIISENRVEGTRLRIGGRTSDKFSKWCELNGYTAYGTRDEKLKYKLGFRTFITKYPRQLAGISYKSDYELLGQSQNAFQQDNILVTLLRRSILTDLSNIHQMEAFYELEPFIGFNTKIFLATRLMTPPEGMLFQYVGNDGDLITKSAVKTTEIRFVGRLAWHEKYLDGTFSHVPTGTKYPILQLTYTKGLRNVFQSDYTYDKLAINITDRIHLPPFGYLDYMIQAGKIYGAVPYPLLELHGGNETYLYDPYAFNMMNYYEFVSDRYLTIQAQHHFDGLFLNHIPLMRKLQWREVISGKFLAGSVSEQNREQLIFPPNLYTLNNNPYYEAGAGIENIFHIFRIDALWRLSYLDHPNIAKFGLRVSMQFAF